MAVFANTAAALSAANAAAASGLPYSTAVAQSGLLAGFRQDCSGLADYVLAKAGVNVGGATTVGLASQLKHGQGGAQGITLWDIPQPGQSGHVIEDIAGNWFESGGMTGGGPHRMTIAQVQQELGVSSLSDLGSGATPRGFIPLTVNSSATSTTSLARLWIEAGGPPNVANTMAAIAMAESGGNVGAQNSSSGAAGLWQILPSAHPQYNVQQLLSDPMYNARAAVAVYKSQGLTAWSTYTSGAYQSFMAGASKDTINYGGPNGGIVRPSTSGPSSGPDITTVLTAYESQYDTPGQGTAPEYVGLFGTPIPGPGDVWQTITGAITAPLDAIKFLVWMFNPVHILRLLEIIVGFGMMIMGLQKVLSGGRTINPSDSSIARVTKNIVAATPAGREARMAMGARQGTREGQVEHARLQARRASRKREAEREQTGGQRRRNQRHSN